MIEKILKARENNNMDEINSLEQEIIKSQNTRFIFISS